MRQSPALGRATRATRVAEYVRMSTDMQEHSIANQRSAIEQYAEAHGMVIVRHYVDEGRSGLALEGRSGLQRLLQDVTASPPYSAVLVLDVSRWGRFQDADQAAFYEYMCVMHGVRVIYVGEPFENDRSPLTAILKSLKRHLAAEYSRELSAKVYAGQARLARLGYHMGATAGYGYRRMLVDASGKRKGLLGTGEYKALLTDRVILVPGPIHEVRLVRDVFELAAQGVSTYQIAKRLNEAGRFTASGKPWREPRIRSMVQNPKYAGACVYGRTTQAIDRHRSEVQRVETPNAFTPLVSPELFRKANDSRKHRGARRSDDEVLADARRVLEQEGRLSIGILDRAPGLLSGQAYMRRFGSLRQLYELLGYVPKRDISHAVIRDKIRPWRESLVGFVAEQLEDRGSEVERHGWILKVDDAWTVAFDTLQSRRGYGHRWWDIRQVNGNADITVFARMAPDGSSPLDFIVMPRVAFAGTVTIGKMLVTASAYTYPSLRVLLDLAEMTRRDRPCG